MAVCWNSCRGIGRKCAFYRGFAESVPAKFPGELRIGTVVTSEVKDDVLSVDIVVTHNVRRETMLSAEYLALLKEWNRLAGSKANSTVVVRRPAK